MDCSSLVSDNVVRTCISKFITFGRRVWTPNHLRSVQLIFTYLILTFNSIGLFKLFHFL